MPFRRELDTQQGTVNLFHLLCEMRDRPSLISRARFRKTWGGDSLEMWTADDAFNQFQIVRDLQDPDRDHPDSQMVTADLDRLTNQDAVLTHVQTTIAHRVPERSDPQVPTFRDFHDAIDVVRDVLQRYYLILTHKTIMEFEPTAQYDVFAAFLAAWIPARERFDYRRRE